MFLFVRLGLLLRASVSALVVAFSRLRRGRARPRWTWMHELIATAMRREFAWLAKRPWAEQRIVWKVVALPKFTVRGVRFEKTTLAGLEAEWITPNDLLPAEQTVLLYLHGGAYLFGSAGEYRDFAARLARAGRARAIVIDYRLAPEHPCPAALEDALAAYSALLASGIPPVRVVIAGDSAGGGLTAALLVALRDRDLPLPAGAALVSPWVDLGARGGSMLVHEHDFFTPELVEHWARTVLAGVDQADPRASPGRAELSGLPPLLVQVGSAEMIHDQAVAFSARARAAGVEVQLRVWEDCFHDWPLFAAVLGDGGRAVEELGHFMREVTGTRPAAT